MRDNGGHMVALKWSMKNLYGVEPGEVCWAASDVGWVVGHSYIVYAPLFHGCTTILYEGKPVGTPDAGAFWRVIAEHGASRCSPRRPRFAPSRRKTRRANCWRSTICRNSARCFSPASAPIRDTVKWAEKLLRVPVIDHWWQTETGWCIAGNPVGLGMLPVKHGSPTVPMPGYDVRVVDEACHEVAANTMGSIVVKLPLPPSCLPTLWQADERLRESYLDEFPGYYKTADAGFKDEDGYIFVMGRTDDIINVAGHRLSTGGMEEVLAAHPDVAECAVLGIKDELKGEVPCGFIVLKSRRQPAADRDRKGMRRAHPREDRPGRGVQARHHGRAAAEDALGKNPARHDQENRRRRSLDHAGDDRRSGGARRDRQCAERERAWELRSPAWHSWPELSVAGPSIGRREDFLITSIDTHDSRQR